MPKIDALVKDFLAQKKIAVVGVSDNRETGCNLAYRKFKSAGYAVSAVIHVCPPSTTAPVILILNRSPKNPTQFLSSPTPR